MTFKKISGQSNLVVYYKARVLHFINMLFRLLVLQTLIYGNYAVYNFDLKGNQVDGYHITSYIGTPPQRVNLLIDTGSSNIAVAAVSQKYMETPVFAYNKSRTFHPTNNNVQMQYMKGSWSGIMGLEMFNLCPEKDCTVICNISCILTSDNMFYKNSTQQGIIGLAYSSIAFPDTSVRPFLDVFFAEKNISNIFALLLCGPYFSSKEKTTDCGKLHVGYFSKMHYRGEIMYTPISYEGFYEVTVIDLKIGNTSAAFGCEVLNTDRSFVDSGTTRLELPPDVYIWVISEIKHQIASVIPVHKWLNDTLVCLKNEKINASIFPTLTLSLYYSDKEYFDLYISPELYLFPILDCAMLNIGVSKYGTIIGSSVLSGYYVIFDRENKRIGFAEPSLFLGYKFGNKISSLQNSTEELSHCSRESTVLVSGFSIEFSLILLGLISISFFVLVQLTVWLWKMYFHRLQKDKSDVINLVIEEDS